MTAIAGGFEDLKHHKLDIGKYRGSLQTIVGWKMVTSP